MTEDASDEGEDGCGNGDRGFPSPRPDLPADAGNAGSLPLDTVFEILSKRRCRLVLSHLEERSSNVVELPELADRVARREREVGAVDDDPDHRDRVSVALHHNHLPRLSNAAIIDYDARSRTVRYWGDEGIAAYLEAFRDEDVG